MCPALSEGRRTRGFAEIVRVMHSGGCRQFADIANGKPMPAEALKNIDL